MEESIQTKREKALIEKLSQKGLIKRRGIKYFLFMLYLGIYKFAKTKYFQIKFFPSNLYRYKTDKLKILVHINGGVGDAVISRILLKNLREIFPKENALIFLCCKNKQTFETFFKQENLADFYVNRGYFLNSYDIVISGCSYMKYEHIRKGIMERLTVNTASIIKNGLKRQKDFAFFINGDPYTDKLLAQRALSLGLTRYTLPLYMLGFEVQNSSLKNLISNIDLQEKEILQKFNLSNKKYITVHYDNAEKQIKNFTPTRVCPQNNWQEFAKLFKQQYPEILIVQIGSKTNFDFVDLCLNDKTTLTELMAILKNSLLHIDGESALVHIAACVNTKSIVMFGPTEKDYFAYQQNVNIKANECTACMWVTKNWRSACPLGYKIAPCMKNISPTQVLAEVKKLL